MCVNRPKIWQLLSKWLKQVKQIGVGKAIATVEWALAPVPLSIFRSNSKFDENSERSSFKYVPPITTICCTRHNSNIVVTCAKYRCDRQRIFYTSFKWWYFDLIQDFCNIFFSSHSFHSEKHTRLLAVLCIVLVWCRSVLGTSLSVISASIAWLRQCQ